MSVAALLFAIAAPILGNMGDMNGWKKKGLISFAFNGALMCGGLALVNQGQWLGALIVYGLSWIGFTGANLFYDSLLVSVCRPKQYNFVSGLGYGFGYLGGGLLVVVNSLMVTKPELFGFADAAEGAKWSFFSVALWWFIFTLPLVFWIKEDPPKGDSGSWLQGAKDVWQTLKKIRKDRTLMFFLIAFFFYIDGVHTIYKMAVDFALSINLESADLIKAIIIVQFVGFPATIGFSLLSQKIGTKRGLYLGIFIYCLVCGFGSMISTAQHFFMLAIVIGLVQGGLQALSRSYYGRLIPSDQAAEYYGFYNMFGKFSAILGPFLVGLTSLVTGSPRASLLIILVLFIAGGFFLMKVQPRELKVVR